MLHKKETSVKNEACVLAFFRTMFHFSVYVKPTDASCDCPHVYNMHPGHKICGISVDIMCNFSGDEGSVDLRNVETIPDYMVS